MKTHRIATALSLILLLFLVSCARPSQEAPVLPSVSDSSSGTSTGSDTPGTPQDIIKEDGTFLAGVFYYSFADAYISSMRPMLEGALEEAGISYQIFDGANNQITQNAQIASAVENQYDLLIVNLVTSGYADIAEEVIRMADGIPVIFFNRAIEADGEEGILLNAYDNICFIGTDPPEAGHLQGQMIGEYLLQHYQAVDLNDDGVITYAMFKGEEANVEAIYRTRYAVEDADAILKGAGRPALSYFDESNDDRYQVDLQGSWSEQAAYDYMSANLAQYNEANDNMIELIICNNDDMAKGAISALESAGYNTGRNGAAVIPVFGVDATDTAKGLISEGKMAGTVKQDAEGMAQAIAAVASFVKDGTAVADAIGLTADDTETFSLADGIANKLVIAYAPYTGE